MKNVGWMAPGPSARVRVQGINGRFADVTVDTGFTGELSLSREDLRRLGFRKSDEHEAYVLGDGSLVEFQVYEGILRWLGRRRPVPAILSPAGDNLLGMSLLKEARLVVEPGRGLVIVERV